MTNEAVLSRATLLVAEGDWTAAFDLLRGSDIDGANTATGGNHADLLELLAQAAYGAGEFEASVEAWERLYSYELGRNDLHAAARAAAMVAMYLMMDTGLMAPVRGWLATAERLLEGQHDTPAHAIVAMTRTYERFMCGDMDSARRLSERAIELGTATGVTPAVVIGTTARARICIFDGDLEGGLSQLDEVGALLMAGNADPLTTGMMYCELICAAQGLGLHDVAGEWTDVMERWRHGAAFGGINGRCRVHRAELLRVSGPCDEAEAEAIGACDELRPWMRREFGWPLAELGTIRLRRGDLAGSEDAFLEAHEHAWSPQPGLALLRLAQGEVGAASTMIAEAIDVPFDIPSKERPPNGELRLAPLLDAQAEIAFAADDAETVRVAAQRLAEIAASFPSRGLKTAAMLAAARADLLEGHPAHAVDRASEAAAAWTEMGAPYEAAAARVVLGLAYRSLGRPDAAAMEFGAAASLYGRYGALGRVEEVAALAETSGLVTATAAPPPPAQRTAVFAASAGMREVGFDGFTTTMRDLKGFRFIARLIADPGREIHVLDLVASDEGVLRPGRDHRDGDSGSLQYGQAGLPVLDDSARDAYRRRLAEIDDDIDRARRMNDPARAELAEADRDYLIAELRRAVGLGGRSRTVGGSSERARTSVTRSIRYAIDQLAPAQPELASRLTQCVRTGTYCSFQPDAVAPIRWRQ
ncbi:MAG: hypothetical protein R2770_10430 [Acidimicrobiales bacterium]